MTTPATARQLTADELQKGARDFNRIIPLFILVPVAIGLAFWAAGVGMNWAAFGLGAFGWAFAGGLRVPIALVLKRMVAPERLNELIGWASGPCEELVRWAMILLTSAALPWAASLGQGWAAIESVAAIGIGLATMKAAGGTDEKSAQVREVLAQRQDQTAGVKGASVMGVIERLFASGLHIGFTLLVAAQPWLVLVLLPAHSVFNMVSLKIARTSMVKMETLNAVVGTVALVLGLLAYKF